VGYWYGKGKKTKKKCCGKFVKKGKHCSSCPVTAARKKKCKADKSYCQDCAVKPKDKKGKKTKKSAGKDKKIKR